MSATRPSMTRMTTTPSVFPGWMVSGIALELI